MDENKCRECGCSYDDDEHGLAVTTTIVGDGSTISVLVSAKSQVAESSSSVNIAEDIANELFILQCLY